MINVFQYDKKQTIKLSVSPSSFTSGHTLNLKIIQDLPLPRVNAHASLEDLNVVHPRVMKVDAPGHA